MIDLRQRFDYSPPFISALPTQCSRILVSSDLWARGIDVQNVGLVVNYDVPSSASDYLHRIGRSGRFGRRGLAVTLIAGTDDLRQLTSIARYYQIAISPAPSALEQMVEERATLTMPPSNAVAVTHNSTGLSLNEQERTIVAVKHEQRKKNRKNKRNRRLQAVRAVAVEKKSKPSKKKRMKRVRQSANPVLSV